MKSEEFNYKDKKVVVKILDQEEIDEFENVEDVDLDNTIDLSKIIDGDKSE